MRRKHEAINPRHVNINLFLVFLMLSVLIAGCAETQEISIPSDYYEVDPFFREVYLYLGGQEVLGMAISPARKYGNITAQYLETCKMGHDPDAPLIKRFSLAPLGKELGYYEPAIPPPTDPDILYVNGHMIFPDFLPIYEKLGERMVGNPLTEAYHNLIRDRYEQHFENLGFYRMNASSEVHLLAYGVLACGDNCPVSANMGNATIDIQTHIDPIFQEFVNNQGADFTGYALSDAYINNEGKWEQILENVVLVAESADNPKSIKLKPLADDLSILVEAPSPKSGNPEMYFYPTQGDLGYEIPTYFFDYLNRHGGLEISGPPIAKLSPFEDQMVHQCFINLCLTFDPQASEGGHVRPEPFGYAYKVLYYKEQSPALPTLEAETPISWPTLQSSPLPTDSWPVATETSLPVLPTESAPPVLVQETPVPVSTESPIPAERAFTFRIWERFPVLGTTQIQEIGIDAYLNGQPMGGLLLELTLTMPNGSNQYYIMPATDVTGKSTLALPPIDAPNGTIIPYLICIRVNDTDKICLEKSFIIWNYP